MDGRATRLGRAAIVVVGLVVAGIVGSFVFVFWPTSVADVLGVLFALLTIVVGGRIAIRIASSLFPGYNVAEVAVEGPISREGGPGVLSSPRGAAADQIIEQIERADAEDNVEALLVKLNTGGGAIVPSDDIRRAAEAFDGPTVAYVTDMCASGGYWIASGCDSFWARDASIVGSIGVRSGVITAEEFAEKVGVTYEGFSRGAYKEAGSPFKELTDEERQYFQGITDDMYERFVERVTEGRAIDAETVRDTEARLYPGEAAAKLGLVDHLGDRDDIESAMEDELGTPVTVQAFVPEHPFAKRLGLSAQRVAYAFGAGMARTVVGEQEFSIEVR